MVRKGLSDQEILHRLHKHNLLDAIFGGAESHVQLVQRGEEILKFLVDQKTFNEQEIRTVWQAAVVRGDETTKLEFYKILESLQIKLRIEDIAIFMELFTTTIQAEKFMRQEIECVAKLCLYCQRLSDASQKAIDLLYDIACQVRPYPKDIIEIAIDKLLGLL